MSFMRAWAKIDKEWSEMTLEERTRKLKTIEVQGGSIANCQQRPDWLARFRLRLDHEPVDLSWGLFQQFHDLGVTNLQSAKEWAFKQYMSDDCWASFAVYGTRDMAWQLSWYIETLEGRYPEDIADQYRASPYLNSRYGVEIADFIYKEQRIHEASHQH